LASPIKATERQFARNSARRSRDSSKGVAQIAAPIARMPANAMLPNCAAPMRMKRNEAPHRAPSRINVAMSDFFMA
jgi:hypothetical protein